MEAAFFELAKVMGLASISGVVARWLKQPVMIGYIAAGLLLTVLNRGNNNREMMELMGQLGVTLLLFLAGMELPIFELKKMGKTAIVAGVIQVTTMSALGFGLAKLLGFATMAAGFVGVGLAFGSTILVVKLLSEKGDLQSLHGKIAMGYLLVQDFIAIGILVMMAGLGRGNVDLGGLAWTVVKGLILVGLALWASETVMKPIMNFLARSTELLFIGSVGWCLGIAALVATPVVGFSFEIGGLLAGLALAAAVEQGQVISRVKPLRDFFLIWFFVSLGANLHLGELAAGWKMGLAFAGLVMVVNPIIVMTVLGRLGYQQRTFFLVAITVSQVSEFSLIILTGAVKMGQVGEEVLATMTGVAILTMMLSTYLIWHGQKVYKRLGKIAKIFEKKRHEKEKTETDLSGHAVLFGHNRVGSKVLPGLLQLGLQTVVVDFNPDIAEREIEGAKVMYGDMSDSELYSRLNMQKAEIVVSTVPDVQDSSQLLSEVRHYAHKPILIMTAADTHDADWLYKMGADYVLVPHSVGGEYLGHMLATHKLRRENIVRFRHNGE